MLGDLARRTPLTAACSIGSGGFEAPPKQLQRLRHTRQRVVAVGQRAWRAYGGFGRLLRVADQVAVHLGRWHLGSARHICEAGWTSRFRTALEEANPRPPPSSLLLWRTSSPFRYPCPAGGCLDHLISGRGSDRAGRGDEARAQRADHRVELRPRQRPTADDQARIREQRAADRPLRRSAWSG